MEEQAIVSLDQKHTSNVAKVHYQKLRSREVATKSSEYIKSIVKDKSDKIDGSTNSSTSEDENLSTENDAVLRTNPPTRITRSKTKVESPFPPNSNQSRLTRQKKQPFTTEEDSFIISGLKKYGKGKWTNILKDPDYKFHPTRNNASLMTRAKAKNLI